MQEDDIMRMSEPNFSTTIMNLAFYLGHNVGPEVDARYPENGNPGVGGTQYLMLLLAHYLAQDPRYKIFILSTRRYVLGGGNLFILKMIALLWKPASGFKQISSFYATTAKFCEKQSYNPLSK